MTSNIWYLRDDFNYRLDGKTLLITCEKIYKIEGYVDDYIEIIKKLEKGVSEVELKDICKNNSDFFEFILESGYLYSTKKENNILPYCSRTIHYLATHTNHPYESQERIEKSIVMILGLGGTGGSILQHLVSAGVINFILVDSARVNVEDLNRQFIYENDSLEKNKVEAAKEYILRINKNCQITTHNSYISSKLDLEKLNINNISLVVNAFDTPSNINTIVGDFCINRRLPLYFAGVGINDAQVGPIFVPGQTSCPSCFEDLLIQKRSDDEKHAREISKTPPKASCGPTNSIVSAMASLDITHFLYGIDIEDAKSMKYITFNPTGVYKTSDNKQKCNCW